jgi:hypothetical protein
MQGWTPVGTFAARAARAIAAAGAAFVIAACGGGGGGSAPVATPAVTTAGNVPAASNVMQVTLDRGIDDTAINAPFVTVRICQPGTSACVEINHVLLDTGSNGLRIAASALPPGFELPLVTTAGGTPVAECSRFASGYAWGSVRRADVGLAGETASAIPVQVVDDPQAPFASVPAGCSSGSRNLGVGAGSRGILGVGLFAQDCGRFCETEPAPNVYFGCTAVGCTAATVPVGSQVINPVAALPMNNNGVVVVMPPLPPGGSSTTGSLILGIGTRENNAFSGATVYTANSQGFVSMVFGNTVFPASFLDTGSNGIFLNDTTLPRCGDFYCPATQATRSVTVTGANGATTVVDFPVDNAAALPPGAALANLAGPSGSNRAIDLGLPFFFGRKVYLGRSDADTPAGPGPFYAW